MLILIDGNRTLKIDVNLQDATALLRFLNKPNYEKIIFEDKENSRILVARYVHVSNPVIQWIRQDNTEEV